MAMPRHRLSERRTRLGLTQADIARRLNVGEETYAAWERGRSNPRPGFRPRLADILELDLEELALILDGEPSAPNGQEVIERLSWYANLEQSATGIRAFAAFTVHALLQTPGYAAAVERNDVSAPSEQTVGELVAVRMARQGALTRDDPVDFSVVLDESVLRRQTGDRAVMAEQLAHLGEVAEWPNVEVRILPLSAGVHSAGWGSFTVLDFGSKSMACIEDRTGFHYLDRTAVVDTHADLFDGLHAVAEPAAIIHTIRKELYE